jgi:predicted Zn-dependent peptidase
MAEHGSAGASPARIVLLAALVAPVARAGELPIPSHPRDLRYAERPFEPPKAEDHRVVLENGLVCYLVADRSVPVLHAELRLRAGELWLPKNKRGLAKLAGRLLRDGGSGELDAAALDRRLDAIAAEIATEIGRDAGTATLWTLSRHAGEALALFADVTLRPRFDGSRIRRAKQDLEEEVEHRDDDPQALLSRRFDEAVYGDHPAAWRETKESIEEATRDDLAAWTRRWLRPERAVLSIAGDFDRSAMEKTLRDLFGGWRGEGAAPDLRVPPPKKQPGALVLVEKGTNQGFVQMGHATVAPDHPDWYALTVMDYILGDGSFTSRVTSRVRNDEGLAYSAGSYFSPEKYYPGTIGLYFQSKAESVAFAAKICVEEARRLREAPVREDELARAKDALRLSLPERFATAARAADALAENEFLGRPLDWYARYGERIAAVTADDVRRVAREHLRPDDFVVVAVGPTSAMSARDERHGCALEDFGAGKGR